MVGGGWSLPPGYPNFSSTWIEFLGTEGALLVDDSHKDVVLNTMKSGMQLPMSTMPGEPVEHVYAGPMAAETVSFLEAVAYDRPVVVTPEHARMVMEVYMAADLSAERNAPVDLPLAGSAAKRAALLEAGADDVVVADADFSKEVRALTPEGAGVDVVIDNVGSLVFDASFNSLGLHGRYAFVGELVGKEIHINPARIFFKRAQLLGVGSVSRRQLEDVVRLA